jgi:glycyl-tRNA synthetase beta chain
MADFLLELRCEEIPARMQAGARGELEKLFRRELDAAGVKAGELTIWSTPRRLALIARGLPLATEAVSEEAKGPPEGAPDAAIDGFCNKNGVTRDQLELRDVKGRMTWFAVIQQPGRAMADLLAAAIPAIIRDFSWPKSMRWGAASIATEALRWVRPLSGIVALLDGEVVPCEVDGIVAGHATMGHRFHSSGAIIIDGVDDYAEKLRAAHVIVDHAERAAMIRDGAAKAAADAGLTLVADEGLVIENAGLTEWPAPLLGRFDEAFLDVPPEVIQLTARVNQKYFVCEAPLPPAGGAGGGNEASPTDAPTTAPSHKREGSQLANAFICTANIDAIDPTVVVDGNRKVLAARLSDARFFWEQDQKKTLAQHAKGLERITFHEKLGTVADKVERVAKLARWLCEEGIVTSNASPREGGDLPQDGAPSPEVPAFAGTREALADLAEQAARLCKADLVTEMVGEFPELQGLMGGYYAAKEGLSQEVAEAIRDHYKPVGQGDEVPTAPVTVAVSLADKLDTLGAFFFIDEKPTGSKDPFALRRAVNGILQLIFDNNLRTDFKIVLQPVFDLLAWPRFFELMESRHFKEVSRSQVWSDILTDYRNFTLKFTDSKNFDVRFKGELYLKSFSGNPGQTPEFHGFEDFSTALLSFAVDRLKVQQREAGVRHDLIDAVFALGGEDDLVRLLARVHALQVFVTTEDGTNLLAGYKRAANILKKEGWSETGATRIPETGEEDPLAQVDDPDMASIVAEQAALRANAAPTLSYTPEPAEKALIDALAAAAPKAAEAVEAERFGDAMAALATLRAAVDTFFEEVIVNDADANKRAARLALLARFRDAVHRVADFSRIEG